jgi:hypothetical protein
MPVRCATCSEELLGAVNRCWKCGAFVTLNLEAFQTPPIRRAPVVLKPKVAAVSTVTSSHGAVSVAELADSLHVQQSNTATPGGMRRRGNPFAADATHAVFVPQASDEMANADAAEKGVWVAIPVAVLAWILAFFFPPAALIVALVAIGLAIWGLSSRKKALAGAVIVLSILGFVLGGYQSARWAYDAIAPEFSEPEFDEDEF